MGRPVEFGYLGHVVDNMDGVVVDHGVDEPALTNWPTAARRALAASEEGVPMTRLATIHKRRVPGDIYCALDSISEGFEQELGTEIERRAVHK